ncbi:MAG: major capsid protein [Pseudomonadota bacterium]
MKAPFVITPALMAVAVAYKNERLIADDVLPRVPVDTEAFEYNYYPVGEFMTPPDTLVGRKSQPNQVEFTAERKTSSTEDHGLDDPVPNKDSKQAATQPNMPDPKLRAAAGVAALVALKREVRAASLVFNAASYGAANKETLVGNDQWSDYVNSNPQDDILAAQDAMIMRPTIGVMGRAVWTKVRQHPKLCKAVFGNSTDAGIISRRAFADLFELDDLFIGEGWVNTAKKGQPANLVRVWGKSCALLHRNKEADTESGTTFGVTAQFGPRVGGEIVDPDIGLHGGVRVRVGESVRELVLANDLGYLFSAAVA